MEQLLLFMVSFIMFPLFLDVSLGFLSSHGIGGSSVFYRSGNIVLKLYLTLAESRSRP